MWSKFTKRPLVACAVIFFLGIAAAAQTPADFLPPYLLALLFFCLSLIFFKKRLGFNLFFCCLVFFTAASHLKNAQILPKGHLARRIPYKDGGSYWLRGYVASQPFYENHQTSFLFRAQEIESGGYRYFACGDILVKISHKKDLQYGEFLRLNGSLKRPFNFRNTCRQSYRDYLSRQDIFLIMHIRSGNQLLRLNQNKGSPLKGLALGLKEGIEEIIFRRLRPVAAGILEAMVLGEKRKVPPLIYNSMIKSGTVHILVVSGFNVGIVAFIIVLFLKLIRVPRRMRFYLATPLIIIYCLITGASTPVVRATVMAIVFMFAYLIQREADIYNSCALAAIFILAVNPRQLFDVGFQLSFASVLSIVYLYPRIKLILGVDRLKAKALKFLAEGCLVALSAWLGTFGLLAYYFRIISPVTVLANMLIVPLASLMTLCGFSLVALDFICPPLAAFFACSTEFVVMFLIRINAFLIGLPGACFSLV